MFVTPRGQKPRGKPTIKPTIKRDGQSARPHHSAAPGRSADPRSTESSGRPSSASASRTDDSFARALYAEYSGILLAVALRLTSGDRQWAEDVVQETLLRAWRNAERLVQHEPRGLMPWLATVARRIVINDRLRGRGTSQQGFDDTLPVTLAVPDDTERTLQRIVIEEALAVLSPAHRQVIVETYLHGRTVDEVARMIGIPPGTVKSRTFYAIRVMRAALQSRGVTL
jgi:RNA polymerase sigma-70 factor, ECF subfamily